MKVVLLYVGSSLLAPLKNAEREINREYKLNLIVAPYNFGAPLDSNEWDQVTDDLQSADIIFVIHVMDGENAARLIPLLQTPKKQNQTVIVINCMPELMKLTRMNRLDVAGFFSRKVSASANDSRKLRRGSRLLSTVGSWMGKQVSARRSTETRAKDNHGQYLKLVDRLPAVLRFVPNTGALQDMKHYLYLFTYFLQPTPTNVQSMLLYAVKQYGPNGNLKKQIRVAPPQKMPSVAVYHPDAPRLFESFAEYSKWYRSRTGASLALKPESTIGLLLMRPQVVSKTTKHYDALIRAIEGEGLSVVPAISTLMDNRRACETFFVDEVAQSRKARVNGSRSVRSSRVSQIVSLTGFSFVGGPAMNDSGAASQFLQDLNRPYRSAVSLDTQTVEDWERSLIGLNPVQAGMQIAIPEIDGATEPFVYGGIPSNGIEPVGLEDRCFRLARRISRWNRLRTAPRQEIKIAMVLFCFPPNKGNVGTAADLDVFPSVWETLRRLHDDGYNVELPSSIDELRAKVLGGNSEKYGAPANIAYQMSVDEYYRVCPYISEIESEWGKAPGRINSFGGQLLIQGLHLGNVFLGIQPTFGYEGDPMRLMMARGSAPHHGFLAFYRYITNILNADAVVHVGTHGAMEFMPGKQIGLSGSCWPDRLIGELPNVYLYSVNNPSEGSIAKRRSYAELISYLTPPMENAGLYKDLAVLKDLVTAYRQSVNEDERAKLFTSIEEASVSLNFLNSSSPT